MTQKQKLETYERFLHKLSIFVSCKEQQGINELVRGADRWSYAQQQEKPFDKEAQRFADWTFRTLCNTPETDSKLRKLQREKEKKQKRTRPVLTRAGR